MDQKINKQVLVLPSWYPNKLDNFSGDFIQRHVKALALYRLQYVIHFVKDEHGLVTKDISDEVFANNNYTEKVVYYHPVKTGIRILDQLLSFKKYCKAFKLYLKDYIQTHGKPEFTHVHVALKAGIAAIWLKKKWGIPFFLSEQWTIYLPEADDRVEHLSFVYKKYLGQIFKQATSVSTVSRYLGEAIQQLYPFITYTVIPNVVDRTLFFPVQLQQSRILKFIHASTMGYQKNVPAILEAVNILKTKGYLFSLDLFGPIHKSVQTLVFKLALHDVVFFKGEVKQLILAKEMQDADALILFSRFETFGCVVIEAQACGIPVIASDLKIFNEIITPSVNGLFAHNGSSSDLAEKLMYFIDNKSSFDKVIISQLTEKFNFSNVGLQFQQFYHGTLNLEII